MKRMLNYLLLTGLLFSCLNVRSQNGDRFPRLQERIMQAKLVELQKTMKLEQPVFERFRPIYIRYEKEIMGIDFRQLSGLMRIKADSLTATEADRLITNQLESAKKLINIREQYYREFRQVISPQQIIQLYQTEAALRRKVMEEIKRRINNRRPVF